MKTTTTNAHANRNLKPGTPVVSTLDGKPGRVVRICTYRRSGQGAWSYVIDTANGREVWEAGELFVPERPKENALKTTRTIAGRKITLTRGQRYMAGRPFASRGRKTYPVTIYQITHGFSFQNGVTTIDDLTYDQANELLAAFNNGPTSFDGRVW